ncbi:MFS transporter [Haliea sp. E1-2-M8]|uniref:MFS transporter n=1 Tax=Haliea sp. E1-2-M8 TaxID=3064706 RepID=UPI00271DBFB4|nr:MFS transporter [Haliea sp. E1-2-M8]MDO8863791.1 MFS transporter [Haliea sp. E1-2-M8]
MPLSITIVIKLRILMFLQYFIWGAWYTTVAVYMRNHGMENLTHWPYTVTPIAAMASPLFLGLFADRLFQTQKMLGVLLLMAGVFMLLTPQASGTPIVFISLLFVFNLCFMPTLALANSLVFFHTAEPEKQFPLIRVFGTLGWIVAGLIISFVLVWFTADVIPERTPLPLYLSGVAALILGFFSFTLPATPPSAKGMPLSIGGILGWDALRSLGSPSFYVFLFSSILICIPLAAYYNFTQIFLETRGFRNIAAMQSLGQMSEAFFMLLLPLCFRRLGVKWVLAIGMGAWALRYMLFSIGAPDGLLLLIITGILLHGICYDFLFVAGQIYVERHASPMFRAQAQSLFVFATYGLGMLVGAQVAGSVYNLFLGDAAALTGEQFRIFWMLPSIFSIVVLIIFAITFNPAVKHR